ncbi:MAG: hypothetical protein K1X67_11035 [Fimbriimonadaceae bacterium]|nr:hypothetical protein [Fimbriimonadaceae bacterium]
MAVITVFERSGETHALMQLGRGTPSICESFGAPAGDLFSRMPREELKSLQIIGEVPLTPELSLLVQKAAALTISYSSASYVNACLSVAPSKRLLTLDTCDLSGVIDGAAKVGNLHLRACTGTANAIGLQPLSLTLQMPMLEGLSEELHRNCLLYFFRGEPDDNSEDYRLGELPEGLSIGPRAQFCQVSDLLVTPQQIAWLAGSGLSTLEFYACCELGGSQIDSLPAIPSSLTELSLDINCAEQGVIAHIIRSSVDLRMLRPFRVNVSAEVLTAISTLKNLECLDLSDCGPIIFGQLRFPYIKGVRVSPELARRQKRALASRFPNAEVQIC